MNGFFSYLKDNKEINLNKQQIDAIKSCELPTLVLAVPGSGKTTSLIIKAGYLVEVMDYNPKRILMLTFSNAASKNLKDKFQYYFGEKIETPFVGTIHKFSNSILHCYEKISNTKYINIESQNGIYNKFNTIRKIYKQLNQELINDDKLDELCGYMSYIKNYMLSEEEIISKGFEKRIPNFFFIYKQYEEYKKKNNFIDFDDMLCECYNILRANTEFLEKIRSRYDYILLDEAQDTSKIQYEIIKLLCSEHKHLFVIGDEDQNLYSWRGAYLDFLLNFKDIYPESNIIFMEQNFRSYKCITSLANKFIKLNKHRYDKDIIPIKERYGNVEFFEGENDIEQCDKILNDLLLCDDNKTYAILYRHNLSSYYIAYKLMKNNIIFNSSNNGNSFINNWVVTDILNYLKLSMNLNDFSIFEKIYYKSYKYLSKETVEQAKKINSQDNLFEKIINCCERKNVCTAITNLEKHFKEINNKKPYDAIQLIEYDLRYREYVDEHSLHSGYSIENINKLISVLELISKDYDTITEFINDLQRLVKTMESSYIAENKSNIIITTIHSAKGLEYDNVYIIDLIDKVFPSIESLAYASQEDFKLLEEERRVFYVALTRAKESITLCTVKKQGDKILEPSRFYVKAQEYYNDIIDEKRMNFKIRAEMKVYHKTHGTGRIVQFNKSFCVVQFYNGESCWFPLKNCFEDGILKSMA